MSPRVPGETPIRTKVVAIVAKYPGLISAEYARRLHKDPWTVGRLLLILVKAGTLRTAPIQDPESLHCGKIGYYPPL